MTVQSCKRRMTNLQKDVKNLHLVNQVGLEDINQKDIHQNIGNNESYSLRKRKVTPEMECE